MFALLHELRELRSAVFVSRCLCSSNFLSWNQLAVTVQYVHMSPVNSYTHTHTHMLCYGLRLPFSPLLNVVRIAALCFSLGNNITKQWSCSPARLCVGVRFCVHTDMCLSIFVLGIKLETCSTHGWICTLCFCTLDLLFVTQSSHARTFRTAELFALRPLTMANIVVEMLLTQVPWEVKDWFLKIPGLWRFC